MSRLRVVDQWIRLIKLFQPIYANKLVDIQRVLFFAPGEHFLHCAESELVLRLGDGQV